MLLLILAAVGLAVFLVSLARAALGALLRLPVPAVHRAMVALVLALALTAALGWRTADAYAGPPRHATAPCGDPADGDGARNVLIAADIGCAGCRAVATARRYVDPGDAPAVLPPLVAELVRAMKRQLMAVPSSRRIALFEPKGRTQDGT